MPASAQPAATLQAATAEAVAADAERSALDAPLFYQLLIGEIELRNGEAGNAYAVLLDAARRTGDESLFKRSVDVALQARAGDQAHAAARAWRQALPQSLEALRYELQLLAALNRSAEVAEPMKLLLERTPEAERAALISTLPRLFQRMSDKRLAATQIDELLQPYMKDSQLLVTRTAARVATGRMDSMRPATCVVTATESRRIGMSAPGETMRTGANTGGRLAMMGVVVTAGDWANAAGAASNATAQSAHQWRDNVANFIGVLSFC